MVRLQRSNSCPVERREGFYEPYTPLGLASGERSTVNELGVGLFNS